jgi:hypothetical protein
MFKHNSKVNGDSNLETEGVHKISIPCHGAEQKERLMYKHMNLDSTIGSFFSRQVWQVLQTGMQANSTL